MGVYLANGIRRRVNTTVAGEKVAKTILLSAIKGVTPVRFVGENNNSANNTTVSATVKAEIFPGQTINLVGFGDLAAKVKALETGKPVDVIGLAMGNPRFRRAVPSGFHVTEIHEHTPDPQPQAV